MQAVQWASLQILEEEQERILKEAGVDVEALSAWKAEQRQRQQATQAAGEPAFTPESEQEASQGDKDSK